ncbi:MAG: peptidoglycan bridge formation glycyltransferase FemA/FemB family protein [Bacteroidales bacterium]|nr:peptidoglycan bridge formation glycyltransferase FemA/FemB family protein [Bacteroidales bacterium]
MIRVLNISDIDRKDWKRLMDNSRVRSFFQSPECWDLYSAMSFMTPFGAAVEEDGKLVGLMIGYIQKDGGRLKSFFTRRAIVNGGPLLSDDISTEALTVLLKEVRRRLKNKAIYVEIRNFEDYSAFSLLFEKYGFKYVKHLNFHIDTSSSEIVENNLGKSRKRDIKQSLKHGAIIVDKPCESQIEDFYGLLQKLYRHKIKTPLFPYEFFSFLHSQEWAKFLLVEFEGRIVGGTVCVFVPGYTVYEWFACGEDGVYKNIYPSTVATYAGIMFSGQANCTRFDMMGAGSPDQNYGVREFKAKFGGNMVEHGRFCHVFNPLLYEVGKLGVRIMKKL